MKGPRRRPHKKDLKKECMRIETAISKKTMLEFNINPTDVPNKVKQKDFIK